MLRSARRPGGRGGEWRCASALRLAPLLGFLFLASATVAVRAAEDLAPFGTNVTFAHERFSVLVVRCPLSVVRCPLRQDHPSPVVYRLHELCQDVRVGAAGALQRSERMIGPLDNVQGGPLVETAADRLEEGPG